MVRPQTMSQIGECERGGDQQHQGSMMYCIVLFAGRVRRLQDRAEDPSCQTQWRISRLLRARTRGRARPVSAAPTGLMWG